MRISTKTFNWNSGCFEGSTIWRGDLDGDGLSGEPNIDERTASLSVIDLTFIVPVFCRGWKEKYLTGKEKLKRLKEVPERARLGINAFLGLWEDYLLNDSNSAIEWLFRNKMDEYKIYDDDPLDEEGKPIEDLHGVSRYMVLEFPGLVMRNRYGHPFWLCITRYFSGRCVYTVYFLNCYADRNGISLCYR
ncbi:MAG: hypothetical protein WCW77_01315 [Patescibacteria group bacterium]|jgi:hypothetical protein